MAMKLREWIQVEDITAVEAARRLDLDGRNPSATFGKWMSGMRRPDADMIQRIEVMTNGKVTALDMHQTRLEYLRSLSVPPVAQSVSLNGGAL